MHPLYQVVINTLLHLKRTCPSCKRDQVVPAGKRNSVVECRFCGRPIPPPKTPNK